MNYPIEITSTLFITDMCFVHTDKPERVLVVINFNFHDESGNMVMSKEDSESDWISYDSYWWEGDLSESWEEAVEDNWNKVKELYAQFVKEEE